MYKDSISWTFPLTNDQVFPKPWPSPARKRALDSGEEVPLRSLELCGFATWVDRNI